jgi:hypothetical protein
MARRARYTIELTWPQVVALREAGRAMLYDYELRPNRTALRHAVTALKALRYQATTAQRDAAIGAGPRLVR